MQKTIITTVGTSIFENYNKTKKGSRSNFTSNYQRLKNGDYSFSEWKKHAERLGNLRDIISKEFSRANRNASAEITSILAITNEVKDGDVIKVHLLATDTILSTLAAELIQTWFNQHKPDITIDFEHPEKLEIQADSKHIIHKLRISSNKDYQEGFMNLIEVVSGLIDENKKAKEETILNITGGYKAIIPIMTLLGQIKSVPLKYIYEESNLDDKTELVEVGNLPISFDFTVFENYYTAFEELSPKRKKKNLPNLIHFISTYFVKKEKRALFDSSLNDENWKEVIANSKIEGINDFKTLINKDKLLEIIKIDSEVKVSLSILGRLLYNEYDKYRKQGLLGSINTISSNIELKLFQYYVGKFENECNTVIRQGYSKYQDPLKSSPYDIDVHIIRKTDDNIEELTAIEVKPAGAYFEELKDKFESGAFRFIVNNVKAKKINLVIMAYSISENPILDDFIEKIHSMFQKISYETDAEVTLKMNWIKLSKKYKTSHNWIIKDNDIRSEVEVQISKNQ
jgi:CRISPR/Cas system-associated protein Csm6